LSLANKKLLFPPCLNLNPGEAVERNYAMPTGPGPTHKAEGSTDASVDDVADLLVEDESSPVHVEGEQILDDGLDVMLETPGPVLVNTFMPPPPAPAPGSSEETEGGEDPGAGANLAYEDLLAKLVLPAKAPEPEPAMPALASSLPLPESLTAPALPSLAAPSAVPSAFKRPSSSSFQIAPPTDELTLVTENPLVAEEQEAAVREGRAFTRDQPLVGGEEVHAAPTEPMLTANGGAKSRLLYLMLGGLLVLGGMILAVLVLKLLMPTPAPQPTVVVAPALPPPPPTPPAHVEPLPPSAPPAAAAAPPAAPAALSAAAAPEAPAPAAAEPTPAELPQPKARKSSGRTRLAHASSPKPAPIPKAVAAPAQKAAPAPAPAAKASKPAGGKKSGKGSSYADPFDN
jgi:hypothetical protein